MDTRFWGPSGWRLLHMITFGYDPSRDKKAMKEFFELLPFVLPCKYCRANLIEHYEMLPLKPALESTAKLTKWLYDIHNLVNDKLKEQGKSIPENPPFSAVKDHYEERLAYGCSKTFFPGWEFLFSIVESHPLSKSEKPVPFHNAPPKTSLHPENHYELVKWNYISGSCRFSYVCQFWNLLPSVLPFEEWRSIWKEELRSCCDSTWKTKDSSFRALWKIRKTIEEKLDLLNRTSYHDLCKMIRYHKSGCSLRENRRTRTCRRLRSSTRKHRRE